MPTMFTFVVDNAVCPGDDAAEATFTLSVKDTNGWVYTSDLTWDGPAVGDPPSRTAAFNIPVSMFAYPSPGGPILQLPDGNYVVTAASLFECPSQDAVLVQAPPMGFAFSQPDRDSGDRLESTEAML